MSPRKSAAAPQPEQNEAPYAHLADADIKTMYQEFADWLEEQTGVEMDVRTVQISNILRRQFQQSDVNQARMASRREERDALLAEREQRKSQRDANKAEREGAKAAKTKTPAKAPAGKPAAKAAATGPAKRPTKKAAPAPARKPRGRQLASVPAASTEEEEPF